MKILIFEGAGWENADSSINSGVGNCRIRTRIRNNEGRLIYLELGGTEVDKKKHDKKWIGYNYDFFGYVYFCYYADSEWNSRRCSRDGLLNNAERNFEYSKENILKFVNENLNCSFDDLEVINDGSVYVHDNNEPLCDCSNGDYIPYSDPIYNIDVLDGVKQLYKYHNRNIAHYEISDSRYAVVWWKEDGTIYDLEIKDRETGYHAMQIGIGRLTETINEMIEYSKSKLVQV